MKKNRDIFRDCLYRRLFFKNMIDVIRERGLFEPLINIRFTWEEISSLTFSQCLLKEIERGEKESFERVYIDMFGEEKWGRIKSIVQERRFSSVEDFNQKINLIKMEEI